MSDNELGLFLRNRREALTPADAGLPAGPRRRTPGLRRAELAMLAGVSVEYVTRLEQGRDRHPSAQVVAALADALQLATGERIHLYRLTKAADGIVGCTGGAGPMRTVRPGVQAVLDRLGPGPAVLLNRLGEILAHTEGYRQLVGPVGLLDAPLPSLPRYVFTDPRARDAYPDWAAVADLQVALLKQGPGRINRDIADLMDELSVVGPEFTRRLETVSGLPAPSGVHRLNHPAVGELRLGYEALSLPAEDDLRILVHLPADAATAAALDRLTGRRPGALRAVPA
ncbi:helix-turn-helix domain-containing protein [Kitasatospora sp. NPDC048365]|uniref:helix-turn-helix domain-containing protein n=1 Tax=Kitasatospora sp. NPDC048365 TaxID=3364050 RepID=UPI00371097DF